jgi:hypothetical protein
VKETYYASDEGEDWETGPDAEAAEVTIHKFGGTPGADVEEETEGVGEEE